MEQQESLSSISSLPYSPLGSGRPWLASRMLRRQVVNVTTLEPVGRVADIIFDPSRSQLAGLVIQLNKPLRGVRVSLGRMLGRSDSLGVVAAEHIVSVSGDVVMVSAEPAHPSSLPTVNHMTRLNEVCELAILTTYGMCLGSLADLLLEHHGGALTGYVIHPTTQGREMLPTLADFDPEPHHLTFETEESTGETENQPEAAQPPADPPNTLSTPDELEAISTRLRVIPASAEVHVGESMILLIAQTEPLPQHVVVISRREQDTQQ